jgi:ABC-type bacteriocin/lantibiotic exporter with double-glycine peptidase domain
MDEPTNALDKINESEIFGELKNIFSGKTFIVVTHNSELKKYFNKIIEI